MKTAEITIGTRKGVKINEGMIGLFFEDINYAADGGLYAEMLENRSFAFYRAEGTANDYYIDYDCSYAWSAYPEEKGAELRVVMGSPLAEENPHYMRVTAKEAGTGLANKAYEGLFLKKNMQYKVTFWARCVRFAGQFTVAAVRKGTVYAKASIAAGKGTEQTCNFFRKYELVITAAEDVENAQFVLYLEEPGTVEFAFVSMFPSDAVAGIFRKDLFEKLKALKPGFLRFPGGCVVEGNTLVNRYQFKDSLKPVYARRNNWNRWAVHDNNREKPVNEEYCHYNQTLGLGFYEYFLLCELIGAKALPVVNVGFACQYQSKEQVERGSEEFASFLQDALDLIEFANGSPDTGWGSIRAAMGHTEPFSLSMLGIGNEQWQTERADFFERYEQFEKAIHEKAPDIRLIGSAGPDITSERYTAAWEFYRSHGNEKSFVYAVDEHYYVKPEWLYEHVDFYDNYDRRIKVFSGEYAAHPFNGFNRPDANTLGGALAEAAFLTGVERNADVVVLASYAPLFARLRFAQWSPDMIWFDAKDSYGTPSYYVQQMYSNNMGTVTLDTNGREKEAAKQGLYYSLSLDEKSSEIILKVVNRNNEACRLKLETVPELRAAENYHGCCLSVITQEGRRYSEAGAEPQAGSQSLAAGAEPQAGSQSLAAGAEPQAGSQSLAAGAVLQAVSQPLLAEEAPDVCNSIEEPEKAAPRDINGSLNSGIELLPFSFTIVRIAVQPDAL